MPARSAAGPRPRGYAPGRAGVDCLPVDAGIVQGLGQRRFAAARRRQSEVERGGSRAIHGHSDAVVRLDGQVKLHILLQVLSRVAIPGKARIRPPVLARLLVG